MIERPRIYDQDLADIESKIDWEWDENWLTELTGGIDRRNWLRKSVDVRSKNDRL